MLRATFAGFSVARGAMSASMKALDVTGQNISNVYTEGYTRQRLDQTSFASGYGNYAATDYIAQVGNGVLVTGISQIRDPYLDIQYRNQMANVGMSDAKASVLEEIESVFDETMKSAIKDAFSDIESKLLDLANSTGAELDDSIVRASMQSLVNLFHFNASSLASKRQQVTDDFEKNSVRKINELLKDISELNKTIKSSEVLGYPALELRDQRNSLIDDLASYVPIEVTYEDQWLSSTEKVENVKIKLLTNDKSNPLLVDHDQYGKFTANTTDKFTAVNYTYTDTTNNTTTSTKITDNANGTPTINIHGGTFTGTLNMLNSSGVFDGDATTEKGFGYYEQSFDLLVNEFASVLNELNQKSNGTGDGGDLFVTSDGATNSNGSPKFTAANIMVNDDWIKGIVKLKTKIDPNSGTTQNDNINKMLEALNKNRDFCNPPNSTGNPGPSLYNGNFYNYYVNIESTLGIDQQSTDNLLQNHITVINTIAQSKDQVSGVSLDEEGVNLMQYQQSYTAAARLMTTLDEALDKLINNTGVVGR